VSASAITVIKKWDRFWGFAPRLHWDSLRHCQKVYEDRRKENETYEIWAYKSASMVSWTE